MYAHPSPKQRHEILQSEWGELERYLRKLTPEQLAHPSACSEWCVTDVVAHLAYFQNGQASRIQDALTGDSSGHSSVPASYWSGLSTIGVLIQVLVEPSTLALVVDAVEEICKIKQFVSKSDVDESK